MSCSAIRAIPRRLLHSIAAANEQALVTVADQGIGIPPDAIDQIATKFFRARNVISEQITGFGSGLSVVAEIVKLHEGTLTIESVEGVGSAFTISLPLYTSAAIEEPAEP